MEVVYKKLKGKELKYPLYSGVIVGYTSNKLILATTDKTDKSFRKFDKKDTPYIEELYKDSRFRYVWCDERDVYNQHPKLKWS